MTSATGLQDQVREILFLRVIVATLGERTAPPWWRTQFLTDVGLRTLGRVFPRNAASSGLSSVVTVARGEHDKRIGLGGRYHLFRLPESLEHELEVLTKEETFSKQLQVLVSGERNDRTVSG